ncbi:MAG: MarR family transcriptional regulator, partial [Aestuariivirga sp.]
WCRERPDIETTPMGTIGRLSRITGFFSMQMEKTFRKHGLNASSFDLLATLRRAGAPYALSAGALMQSMMITSGTTTNRIKQLEKAKLIIRKTDAKDRRVVMVRLSPLGFAKIENALVDHLRTQAALISRLSPEEIKQMTRLLRKLESANAAIKGNVLPAAESSLE